MIGSLKEVNRVLRGVEERSDDDKGALIESVIESCSGLVLDGVFRDHYESIRFCIDTGIVTEANDRLRISDFGKELLSLDDGRRYSLNSNQRHRIVRECLLKGKLSGDVQKIIAQFSVDYKTNTFVWSKVDGRPLKADRVFLDVLVESGLIIRKGNMLIVNPDYVRDASLIRSKTHHMTDDELQERMAAQKIVGGIAEEIVVELEKKRLLSSNLKGESELVQSISNVYVNAGYDVISFDGESQTFEHDRFIEVKGSSGPDMSFLISSNEIEVAKTLGSRYWIYFVSGIDIKTKKYDSVQVFQDPVKSILEDPSYRKDCVRVWVRKNPMTS